MSAVIPARPKTSSHEGIRLNLSLLFCIKLVIIPSELFDAETLWPACSKGTASTGSKVGSREFDGVEAAVFICCFQCSRLFCRCFARSSLLGTPAVWFLAGVLAGLPLLRVVVIVELTLLRFRKLLRASFLLCRRICLLRLRLALARKLFFISFSETVLLSFELLLALPPLTKFSGWIHWLPDDVRQVPCSCFDQSLICLFRCLH